MIPISTFLKTKQKRSAMSQESKPLQITDEMMKAFLKSEGIPQGLPEVEGMLRSSYKFFSSFSSSEKVDWEIVWVKNNWGTILTDSESIGIMTHNSNLRPHWSIHSVRRLSDGEVFRIGDRVRYCPESRYGSFVIEKIWINSIDNVRCMVSNKDQSIVEVIEGNLEKIKAPIPEEKPVLFTTEDGVELRDRSAEVWGIDRKKLIRVTGNGNTIGAWLNGWYTTSDFPNPKDKDLPIIKELIKERFAIFSTEQAANEYVTMNKPCLSVSDIQTIMIQLSHVNERDINKYQYNDQLRMSVFDLAKYKIEEGK